MTHRCGGCRTTWDSRAAPRIAAQTQRSVGVSRRSKDPRTTLMYVQIKDGGNTARQMITDFLMAS